MEEAHHQNRCGCEGSSVVHRGKATQSQISVIRVPVKGQTEDGINQTLGNHGSDDRIVDDLGVLGIRVRVIALIGTCEQRISQAHQTAGHGISKPVRVVDQCHLLMVHSDPSDSDVFVTEVTGQELPIAVFDIEVLVCNAALVKGTIEGRPKVAISFLKLLSVDLVIARTTN